MRKKEMLRRKIRLVLLVGTSGLSGAGLMLLGRTGVVVLGGLVFLALVVLTSAVVFSPRDEPSQRLLELIKALWR